MTGADATRALRDGRDAAALGLTLADVDVAVVRRHEGILIGRPGTAWAILRWDGGRSRSFAIQAPRTSEVTRG